jgi:hypothetical protein
MGFFSSKKTYVSSSIYNMAGDVNERPIFLRSLILGGLFKVEETNISDTLTRGYINGPAMKVRSFFRWAENNYTEIGIPDGNLGSLPKVNADVVAASITVPDGYQATVQFIDADRFDYSYWAEQYMFENHPSEVDTEWVADMNDAGTITIQRAGGGTYSFTPTADQDASYIYAIYNEVNIETKAWGPPKMFIYEIGSGNISLDNMIILTRSQGEFVPFIPIRLDNQWLAYVNPSAA